MRTKKLEKYFMDYLQANPITAEDDGSGCVLYSSEEFHINHKQKTLYLKGIGVSPLPEIDEQEKFKVEWIGLIKHLDQEFADIVMGDGNPYQEKYSALLPHQNGVIIAVPNSVMMKAQQ